MFRPRARAGISIRMLASESIAGVLQRPGRSALTTLGTVLGVGAFVAVLGITGTANGQVSKRFNELSATEVSVESVPPSDGSIATAEIPGDADTRMLRLNGVKAAGTFWDLGSERRVESSAPGFGNGGSPGAISVTAATPGLWDVAGPTVEGRVFDGFLAEQNVAVVGRAIARQLNIGPLVTSPAVFIDGVPFTVIGVVDDTERAADALLSVTIPAKRATQYWGEARGNDRMLIETDLGAATQVASQAPLALRADFPDHVKATAPLDPKQLQTTVSGDLNTLFLALAGICLLIGAVGIANTTLVAVLERVPEIGLRRALGASPRHVGAQFLLESMVLGGLGGLIGTALGTLVTLGVSLVQQWTAILPMLVVLMAPALGALAGLLAGLYPALRASRIEPIEAFRR